MLNNENVTENNKNLIALWGNDDKRKAFLGTYETWEAWASTEKLGLFYYRYELPSGVAIIAEKHFQRKYNGYGKTDTYETDVSYYTQKSGEPFLPSNKIPIGGVVTMLKDEKVALQKKVQATA